MVAIAHTAPSIRYVKRMAKEWKEADTGDWPVEEKFLYLFVESAKSNDERAWRVVRHGYQSKYGGFISIVKLTYFSDGTTMLVLDRRKKEGVYWPPPVLEIGREKVA